MATAYVQFTDEMAIASGGTHAANGDGFIVLPMGPPGPQGPQGSGSGSSSVKIDQLTPAGTWILPHALSRIPMVDVFLPSGEQVDADVIASTTQVTVTFASPVDGFVIII